MKVSDLFEDDMQQPTRIQPRKRPVYDPASLRGQQVAANKKRLKQYMEIVPSQIAGMPCLVGVISISKYIPATHWEPAEGGEIEYDILDSKGRPAPWLERKMSARDESNIQDDVIRVVGNGRPDYD